MKDFNEFFLMSTDDVKRYAVEVLGRFSPDEETDCIEIGDGNINYVYKIVSKRDGHSVIIKQADKLLRSSGRPLMSSSTNRFDSFWIICLKKTA